MKMKQHTHEDRHAHHHEPLNGEFASRMSQLGAEACTVTDSPEMAALRGRADADSLVELAGMHLSQYRYKEAAELLSEASRLRPESADILMRLGGINLTLFRYDDAERYYDEALRAGASEYGVNFAKGVESYLRGGYEDAALCFEHADICTGESFISAIYWDTLSSSRAGIKQKMLTAFDSEMDVGHHTAYKDAMSVFAEVSEPSELTFGESELDDAIKQYALAVYYEQKGDIEKSREMLSLAADHESVWPSVACLAAFNDLTDISKKSPIF